MSRSHFFSRLGALALLVLASGCTLLQPPHKPKPKPLFPQPPVKKSYWKADAVTGDPAILINLSEQRAHFFRDQTEVGQSLISSGKKKFETPTGDFQIIQLDKNHVSNLYGDFVDESGSVVQSNVDVKKDKRPEGAKFRGAKMPFFMRFHGGAGMHAGRLPGYAASHGCVRMPRVMAEHFFANAPLGTPVKVIGTAPAGGGSGSPVSKARPKPAKPAADPSAPATPTEVPPPAPAPESTPKADEAPEKKPEPAAPAPPSAPPVEKPN